MVDDGILEREEELRISLVIVKDEPLGCAEVVSDRGEIIMRIHPNLNDSKWWEYIITVLYPLQH